MKKTFPESKRFGHVNPERDSKIYSLRKAGLSYVAIGAYFGLSSNSARRICIKIDWDRDFWKRPITRKVFCKGPLPLDGRTKGHIEEKTLTLKKQRSMARNRRVIADRLKAV